MDDTKNSSYHRPIWDDIRTSSSCIRGVLATDVDHEGAYAIDPVDRARAVFRDTSDALVFTVRSVVKIVQQVPAP